jgi:1,4-alpha-glucan branching enzyme
MRNSQGNDSDPQNDISEAWELLQQINDEIKNRFPWKLKIAEDNKGNTWLTKSKNEGGAGFDAQWDVHFVHPIKKVLVANDDSSRDLNMIEEAVCYRENDDAFKRIIYMESHDEVTKGKKRIPEEISPGNAGSWFAKKRSAIGAALVFTSPGIPMIFQGQEMLSNKNFNDKTPLDWSYVKKLNGNIKMYKELIRLRRNMDNTTAGLAGQHVKLYHKNNDDKIIAFYRWDSGGERDDTVVIINFADKNYKNYNLGFPAKGFWKIRFNSDSNQYDPEYGNFFSPDIETEEAEKDGMKYSGNISIGAYSVLIYSQD